MGHLECGVKIRPRMCHLEDPQQMLKRRDELREVACRASDAIFISPARLHGSEILPGEAVVVPQVGPEIVPVAGVQKVEVCLTDGNVLRSGVRVELLVPLLQEAVLYAWAVAFLDSVVTKDVQDSHTDVVAIPPATRESRHGHPGQHPRHHGVCALRKAREGYCQALLGAGHVLPLVVVHFFMVPTELLVGTEAKPSVQQGHAFITDKGHLSCE
mmetsp:Transcript_22316/g.61891  ORF Transcript_22316/g.61891 Transcript_22316/m.61891 type:complete len:214 (-) Transcript_22316:961-1602(-)